MKLSNDPSVMLVHGAWADGSSWSKIIGPLAAEGIRVFAAPLPLTSFGDDVAALDRALERVPGPVVLSGHAYGGAVIGATRSDKVRALVYVAGLAPDEGETVTDLFYRHETDPSAHPPASGGSARRRTPSDPPSRRTPPPTRCPGSRPSSGRPPLLASASPYRARCGRTAQPGSWSPSRTG